MRILVADDDAFDRRTLLGVLQRDGHEVVEAHDGAQAWELYDRKPFRVVVSDWVMPRLDGVGLCRKIRGRPRTGYTYVILLTGLMVGEDNYRTAIEAGVDDLLAKPAEPDLVRMRLRVAERIISLCAQVVRLEGLIPVCMYCKQVRRDTGAYMPMEAYIEENSLASFTHGICPDCMDKHVRPQVPRPKRARG